MLEKASFSLPGAFYRNRNIVGIVRVGFFFFITEQILFIFVLSKKRKRKGERKWKVFEGIIWPVSQAMVPGGR